MLVRRFMFCYYIDPQTFLLPLASCSGLEDLECDEGAVDLEELRKRMQKLKVDLRQNEEDLEDN